MLSETIISKIDEITCEQSLNISLYLMEYYCKALAICEFMNDDAYITESGMTVNTSTNTTTSVPVNGSSSNSTQNKNNQNFIKNQLTNVKNAALKVIDNVSKFIKNFIERIKIMFSKDRIAETTNIDNKLTHQTPEQKAKVMETIDQIDKSGIDQRTFQNLKQLLLEIQGLVDATAKQACLPTMTNVKPKDVVKTYLNEHKLPVMYPIEEITKNINNAYSVFNAIDAYAKELNKSLLQKKMQQKAASTFHKNAKFYDEFRTKMNEFSKTMTTRDMHHIPTGYKWTFVDPKQYMEYFQTRTQMIEKLIQLGTSIEHSFNNLKTGLGYAVNTVQRNADKAIADAKKQNTNGTSTDVDQDVSVQTSEQIQDMQHIQHCAAGVQTTVVVLKRIMLAKKLTEDLLYGLDKIISVTVNNMQQQ